MSPSNPRVGWLSPPAPVERQRRQLARAVAAARTFLSEATATYQTRPRALCGRLKNAGEVHEFILAHRPTLVAEDQEVFLALVLNSRHAVTRVEEIARGTLASVDVHPREVFRALVLHAAAAAFLVHNHPSGSPEPSHDDLALTARLRDAGTLLGIPVLDHVIVASEGYVSLAERGLL